MQALYVTSVRKVPVPEVVKEMKPASSLFSFVLF